MKQIQVLQRGVTSAAAAFCWDHYLVNRALMRMPSQQGKQNRGFAFKRHGNELVKVKGTTSEAEKEHGCLLRAPHHSKVL